MRPFDVVEGPTKLLDLRAEPLAIGPVLLALGSEAVGLAAEDLDVPRLFLCLMEMLLEADMLVTVRPFDVVEGPTKLLDLRAEPLDFGPVSLAARFGGRRPLRGGLQPLGIALALARVAART